LRTETRHEDIPSQQFQALFELESCIGYHAMSDMIRRWYDSRPVALPNVLHIGRGAIRIDDVSSLTQDNSGVVSLFGIDAESGSNESKEPTTGTGSA
jgi:hypothetical protein